MCRPLANAMPRSVDSTDRKATALDFGGALVASERRAIVVISNPSEFAVTVTRVVVEGTGFAVSPQAASRADIPAHGQLSLTVLFQPLARRVCNGFLLIEIGSAGVG